MCIRDSVVDEAAMYKALKEKWIARAATDVFEEEPTPKDNPLFELDNICLLYTSNSIMELRIEVLEYKS